MATLLEVLKDKQSRKPFVRLLVLLSFLSVFTFAMGLFAAFVYSLAFPRQYDEIRQLFSPSKEIKEPVLPKAK